MNNDTILLHLSLIDGIGPVTIQKIVNACNQISRHLHDIYTFDRKDFIQYIHCSLELAEKLVNGLRKKDILVQELLLIEKNNIQWTTLESLHYPAILKQIYAPPPVLYWQGSLSADIKGLAVVGSRQANNYARTIIDSLIPSLIAYNWTIISGGALGADGMAHHATLSCSGKTIAVLGSGLLKWYPYQHKKLFNDILEHDGALVSSFPLTMMPATYNFPARNRIIAGLSAGCLIVQAAEHSGALITAKYALEEGREVFAVPGSILDPLSSGCHYLLSQGAKLVSSAHDILKEFTQNMPTNISLRTKPCSTHVQTKQSLYESDSIHTKIIEACKQPTSLSELEVRSKMSLDQLYEILFELQLKGIVKQNYAGMWEQI